MRDDDTVSGMATRTKPPMVSWGTPHSPADATPRSSSSRMFRERGTLGTWQASEQFRSFRTSNRRYRATDLFPTFRNRAMNRRRRDRAAHLRELGLDVNECDELAELSVSGGRSHTDSFETFPGIEPDPTGRFHTQLTLHGLRHTTFDVHAAQPEILVGAPWLWHLLRFRFPPLTHRSCVGLHDHPRSLASVLVTKAETCLRKRVDSIARPWSSHGRSGIPWRAICP